MTTKTVYATVTHADGETTTRLRADLPEGDSKVFVGISNGPALGWYKLERFAGSRLTAATLRDLFTPKGEEPSA